MTSKRTLKPGLTHLVMRSTFLIGTVTRGTQCNHIPLGSPFFRRKKAVSPIENIEAAKNN
jgi:hypothetical protein